MIWGLPGYCVLVSDDPTATRLSDLASDQRSTYLESMARLAGAVEAACAEADPAFRRVDVGILGSADDFLHTHIWPRYEWEPADLVWRPVWLYRLQHWCDPAYSETRVRRGPDPRTRLRPGRPL